MRIDPFTTRGHSLRRGSCYLATTALPGGGVRLDAYSSIWPHYHFDVLTTMPPLDLVYGALGRGLRPDETFVRADRYDRGTADGWSVTLPFLFDSRVHVTHAGLVLRLVAIDDDAILALDPPAPLDPDLVSLPSTDDPALYGSAWSP